MNFLEEVVQYKKELLKEKKISLSDLKKDIEKIDQENVYTASV